MVVRNAKLELGDQAAKLLVRIRHGLRVDGICRRCELGLVGVVVGRKLDLEQVVDIGVDGELIEGLQAEAGVMPDGTSAGRHGRKAVANAWRHNDGFAAHTREAGGARAACRELVVTLQYKTEAWKNRGKKTSANYGDSRN